MKLRKWCAWCGLGTSVCACKNPSLLTDYSEMLDWVESLLDAPIPTPAGMVYATHIAVETERARMRALIAAERGK